MKNLLMICWFSVGGVSFANAIICKPADIGDGTICVSENPEEAASMVAGVSSLATESAMESQESHNEPD